MYFLYFRHCLLGDAVFPVRRFRDGTRSFQKRAILSYLRATRVPRLLRLRIRGSAFAVGRTLRDEQRPPSRDGPPDLRERAGGGGGGARIGVPRGDAPGCDRIAEGAGVHVLPRERRARPENVHVLRGVRRRRRGGIAQEDQALRGVGRVPKRGGHRAPTQHRVRRGVLDRPGHDDARIRGARLRDPRPARATALPAPRTPRTATRATISSPGTRVRGARRARRRPRISATRGV